MSSTVLAIIEITILTPELGSKKFFISLGVFSRRSKSPQTNAKWNAYQKNSILSTLTMKAFLADFTEQLKRQLSSKN